SSDVCSSDLGGGFGAVLGPGTMLSAVKNVDPFRPWFPSISPAVQSPTGLVHPVLVGDDMICALICLHSVALTSVVRTNTTVNDVTRIIKMLEPFICSPFHRRDDCS